MKKANLVHRKVNEHEDWNKKPDNFLQHQEPFVPTLLRLGYLQSRTIALTVSSYHLGESVQWE